MKKFIYCTYVFCMNGDDIYETMLLDTFLTPEQAVEYIESLTLEDIKYELNKEDINGDDFEWFELAYEKTGCEEEGYSYHGFTPVKKLYK